MIDHGFCHSVYFKDPDNFHLEVACDYREYNPNEELQLDLLDRKLGANEGKFKDKI